MPTQKNQGQNGSLFFKPMVNTMSTIQNTTREKYNFAALIKLEDKSMDVYDFIKVSSLNDTSMDYVPFEVLILFQFATVCNCECPCTVAMLLYE